MLFLVKPPLFWLLKPPLQYYGTPLLSLKAAAFHRLDKNDSSGPYSLSKFFGGGRIHPGMSCQPFSCTRCSGPSLLLLGSQARQVTH